MVDTTKMMFTNREANIYILFRKMHEELIITRRGGGEQINATY